TTDALRSRYGSMYNVHIVHTQAPHTSDDDMEKIRDWVADSFAGAVIEQKTYHGQLRFSVPADVSHENERYTDGEDGKSSASCELGTSDEIQPIALRSGGSTLAGPTTRP